VGIAGFSAVSDTRLQSLEKGRSLEVLKEVQAKYERHEALAKDVGTIYAGLGDKDQVFAGLKRTFRPAPVLCPESDGSFLSSPSAAIRVSPTCCGAWVYNHDVLRNGSTSFLPPSMIDDD
jgi:hypothetical protein